MGHHFILGLEIFILTYLLNTFYISVLYHRGLAHGAVVLNPWLRKFVIQTGSWVTGIDPKAWCCMHRLHHIHSDTPDDPHSPVHQGVLGVMLAQLRSYEDALRALIDNRDPYAAISRDLDFPVHWLNQKKLWFLPYLLHGSIAAILGFALQSPWVGLGYYFGLMSHPVQGWMVNALAHKFGYRNFSTPDNSRNNTLVAWLVMGEGLQNNHHFNPRSAKFSAGAGEVDLGYGLCQLSQKLGLLRISSPET